MRAWSHALYRGLPGSWVRRLARRGVRPRLLEPDWRRIEAAMARPPLRPLLDPRERESDERRNRVVDGFVRRRGLSLSNPASGHAHWDAAFYGLDRVQRFSTADPCAQGQVLEACGEQLLWESYYLEQCGIAFCARMVLLADDVPTRKLYSLIGADEATHEHWVRCLAAAQRQPSTGPVQSVHRRTGRERRAAAAQLCAAVVLEGFGIQHYRRLAQGCREPALMATLRTMMSDEGAHHAGGVAAFDARRLDRRDQAFALEAGSRLLEMIRVGPQAVVAELARAVGQMEDVHLESHVRRARLRGASAAKLDALKKLLEQPGMQLVGRASWSGCACSCPAPPRSAHECS